jgi:dihydroxyacid dehydratase/phosphogluconate dehydratase
MEERPMKMLLLLGAIGLGLVAAGVIHLQKNGDKVDISIDETKLRQTTAKVVQEGELLMNEAAQSAQQAQQNPTLKQEFQQVESSIQNQAQRLVPVQSQQ